MDNIHMNLSLALVISEDDGEATHVLLHALKDVEYMLIVLEVHELLTQPVLARCHRQHLPDVGELVGPGGIGEAVLFEEVISDRCDEPIQERGNVHAHC